MNEISHSCVYATAGIWIWSYYTPQLEQQWAYKSSTEHVTLFYQKLSSFFPYFHLDVTNKTFLQAPPAVSDNMSWLVTML